MLTTTRRLVTCKIPDELSGIAVQCELIAMSMRFFFLLLTAPWRQRDPARVRWAGRHSGLPRYWSRCGPATGSRAVFSGRTARVRAHLQHPRRKVSGHQALLVPVEHITPVVQTALLHKRKTMPELWKPYGEFCSSSLSSVNPSDQEANYF